MGGGAAVKTATSACMLFFLSVPSLSKAPKPQELSPLGTHPFPLLCLNDNFYLFFPVFNLVLQGKVLTHMHSVNNDNVV